MSQDIGFSQFYMSRMYLNPAFVGANERVNFFSNYRNQWPDIEAAYTSYSIAWDQPMESVHGGIGGFIMNDRQAGGTFNSITANLAYAYPLKLTKYSFIRSGLQVGAGQNSLKSNKLTFSDMFNQSTKEFSNASSESFGNRNTLYPDFALGVLWDYWDHMHNSSYSMGVSAHHLLKPKITDNTKLPRIYTVHLSSNFPIAYNRLGVEEIRMYPAISADYQNGFNRINYFCQLIMEKYMLGVGLRHNIDFQLNTFVFCFGIIRNDYVFSYTYDLTPSNKDIFLSKFGAHEVTFLLNLRYKGKKPTIKFSRY